MSVSDEFSLNVPIVVSAVRWEKACDGFVPKGAICGGRTFDGEIIYIGRTNLAENKYELTPGILIPSEGQLTVSFGTGVRTSKEYEVLVTNDPRSVQWVPCNAGRVPPNAVIGGIDCSYSEPLYIGKTKGNLTFGRTWRGLRFPGSSMETSLETNMVSQESTPSDKGDTQQDETTLSQDARTSSGDFGVTKVSFPGKVHRSHKCLYVPYNHKEFIFRDYEVLALTTSPASLAVISKCALLDHLLAISTFGKNPGSKTRRSSSMLMSEIEDFVGVEKEIVKKINTLPLPKKLKEFCRQGME